VVDALSLRDSVLLTSSLRDGRDSTSPRPMRCGRLARDDLTI
jgi:hypothetical protein